MDNLFSLLKQGEGIDIEFKECTESLTKEVYPTICSFSNRIGGHLFLGIKDDGTVIGVNKSVVKKIRNNLVTSLNNNNLLQPTVYVAVNEYEIDGKIVLYVYVPETSEVQRLRGRVWDRNEDGDFDITDSSTQVAELYLRKQKKYTVNEIYPYCDWQSDLRLDLLSFVRSRAVNLRQGKHPWANLDDLSLLRSAGLYLKDMRTGQEGITLAGILLFGKDETIFSVLPHYRTDALLKRENIDRYDDRDDVRTNLLESYDRLMAFIAKHLNDPFYLEGTVRISLRDLIARELVVNTLIHREYSLANPARLIIEKDKLIVENANRPHGYGFLDLHSPAPYPKNPVLARVFHEIGYADELGSGIRNTVKYTKIYSGEEPQFIEKDLFQIIIPLKKYPEKVPIGGEKVPIGGEKVPIGGEKVPIDKFIEVLNLSPIMLGHVKKIYQELFLADYFSSKEVAEILKCSVRNAAKVIKIMYDRGLLIKTDGYGKGKYKFISDLC